VAFVGQSGCGKSTTIQLIQRFYDVNVSFRSACLAFGCQAVTDTCIVVNCYGITTGDISCGKYSRTIVFFMFHLNSDEICYILRMPWLVAGGVLLFYAENLRLLLFWQMLHLLEKLAYCNQVQSSNYCTKCDTTEQWCRRRGWKRTPKRPKVLIWWKSGQNLGKSGQKWRPTWFDLKK